MNFKHISVLNKEESQEIKGGLIFSCEEKKRNIMLVSVYSDAGKFLESYKVSLPTVDSFITNFNFRK